ncbi:MAG: ParA family protein [Dehalococcoidia bacterium]
MLMVDLDSQGNLTRRMGYEETEWPTGQKSISDVLRLRADNPCDPAEAIVRCAWEHELAANIDLLPSIPPMMEARARESGRESGTEHRLRRALDKADGGYDFTIIDIPPGLGHPTDMAFAAGDLVLIVLKPEYDFVQGAVRVVHYVEAERDVLGRPDLQIVGVIVTDVEDNATHRAQLKNLPVLFHEELLWSPQVPHRATWSSATSDGIPVQLMKGLWAGELAEMFGIHAQHLVDAVTAKAEAA